VFNGSAPRVHGIARASPRRLTAAGPCRGTEGEIEAEIDMAVDPISNRYDRTIVTVRSSHRPFSFAADEVARGDRILVDDLGVLVVRADDKITLEGYRQAARNSPAVRSTIA